MQLIIVKNEKSLPVDSEGLLLPLPSSVVRPTHCAMGRWSMGVRRSLWELE